MATSKWALGILVLLLALSLGGNIWSWNNKSATGELIAGVSDELSVALRRNSDLTAELQRATDLLGEYQIIERVSATELEAARAELKESAEYIERLKGQFGVSEQSIGRLEGLIDRGEELVAEGRSYLEERED